MTFPFPPDRKIMKRQRSASVSDYLPEHIGNGCAQPLIHAVDMDDQDPRLDEGFGLSSAYPDGGYGSSGLPSDANHITTADIIRQSVMPRFSIPQIRRPLSRRLEPVLRLLQLFFYHPAPLHGQVMA